MVQPRRGSGAGSTRCSATSPERTEDNLGNDGTDLSRGSGETMGGGTITGGEALAGYNEGGGVRAEVEEELSEDVEGEESMPVVGKKLVVSESDDDEEDGKDGEAHDLNWFTAKSVDSSD